MEKIDFFEKFNTFQIYYKQLLKDNIYDNGNLASYIRTYYIENNKIYGKLNSLKQVEMLYSRGKIIIKPQIGDILDY